jgi:SAM-dependent methyltransferase
MDPYVLEQHAELEESHWWLAARKQVIGQILDRFLDRDRQNQRILDVGCGAGSMIELLGKYGQVTALDESEQAIALVKERYPTVTAAVGEVPGALPLGGDFNAVTAFDVIEHISDDLGALTAIRDAMSPGGLFVIAVPAHPWLWGPHDDLSFHKRRYTRRGLLHVLREAGFSIEWVSYYNTLLFPAVAVLRVGRRILRPNAPPASDFDVDTGGPINNIMMRLFAAERHLLKRMRLPFGVSLVVVARRS